MDQAGSPLSAIDHASQKQENHHQLEHAAEPVAGAALQGAAAYEGQASSQQSPATRGMAIAESMEEPSDPSLSPSVLEISPSAVFLAHPGAAAPDGPRYQHPTAVQPKPPLAECQLASQQACVLAFTPATLLGIRTLPNALSPDFKQQLFNHLVEQRRAELLAMRAAPPSSAPAAPRLAYTLQAGPAALGVPVAAGQRQVQRSHPYSGTFTMYDYLPSEYERARLGDKFLRLQSKLAQVTPVDFVVRSTPPAPKGTPAFSEFTYSPDPTSTAAHLQLVEDNMSRAAALAGPFVTAGRPQSPVMLRGRADECMMQLCKLLSTDWPTSFMQVFEDKTGAVVVSFDRSLAVQEGDLSSYMQNLAKSHSLTSEFKLTKDGMQWGLEDQETNTVFYLFWPPWVRHRFVGMATTQSKAKQAAMHSAGSMSMESSKVSQASGGTAAGQPGPIVTELMGMTALARSAAQLPASGPLKLPGMSGNSMTDKQRVQSGAFLNFGTQGSGQPLVATRVS